MSDQQPDPHSEHARDLAAELRLRPERPPVTRLSRKVLVGLAAIAAVLVSGALLWGLYQGRGKQAGSDELYNTENKPTPDGLAILPRDYTGVPRNNLPPTRSGVPPLGPPLPGDLGRPMLNAQGPGPGAPAIDGAAAAHPGNRGGSQPAGCSLQRIPGSDPGRRSRRRRLRAREWRRRSDSSKRPRSTPTRF